MKRWKYLGCILLFIFLFAQYPATARLVLEGTLAVELFADPNEYNPLEGLNEILPGVFSGDVTKVGIAIRSDDETNRIRAYFPYLISASYIDHNKYLSIGNMTPAEWWQSYFGSNYYFVARGNPFTVGVSNRKIHEDEDYSFFSFKDLLGGFVAPNSDYPMITAKLSGDFLNAKVEAYKIYDSNVAFLPIYEKFPAEVGSIELRPGVSIASYSYGEELADYTLLKVSRPVGGFAISFLYGDKRVENPGFLLNSTDKETDYYRPDSTRRLGVLKRNYGVDFSRSWSNGVELRGEYLTSSALWREYNGTHTVDGRTMPRWDELGTITGNAGTISLSEIKIGPAKLGAFYRAIDPSFQTIAARHPDYSYNVYNEVFGDVSTPLLLRAFYDPKQRYARESKTSELSKYLGYRSTGIALELPGKLASFPSVLTIKGIEHRRIDGIHERKEIDFDTGVYLLKDYREIGSKLSLNLGSGKQLDAFSTKRAYFADCNYLTCTGLKWSKVGERLANSLLFERYSRLRDYQWPEDEPYLTPIKPGSMSRLAWELTGELKGGFSFKSKVDLRNGDYEKDLSIETEDRVLNAPYNLVLSQIFAKKDFNWSTKKGTAAFTLATELFSLNGDASNTKLKDYLGLGMVNYAGLSYPLFKDIRQELILLNVRGPEEDNFPGKYVKNTYFHELIYQPTNSGSKFRVGYSVRPQANDVKQNFYAVISGEAGGGKWSLTYGLGTLREFTEPEYLLPGQWRQQNPYITPEVRGKPWEIWSDSNIAFGNEKTVEQFSVRFWYDF